MKKFLLLISVVLLNNFLFGENYLKGYVSEFLNKGNYILIEDGSNNTFYPKHNLARVECDNDELQIIYVDAEYDYESKSFSIKKYLIKLDENSNLVINKNK
jgi:hypothetical protein